MGRTFRVAPVYNLENLSEKVKAYIDVERSEENLAQKVKEASPSSKRQVWEGRSELHHVRKRTIHATPRVMPTKLSHRSLEKY